MTLSFLIPSILLILSLITAGIIYWFWYNCFRIESRRYLKALCCGNPAHFVEAPAIALTFDDGIHPEYTPKILEILEKHQIKATFFHFSIPLPNNMHITAINAKIITIMFLVIEDSVMPTNPPIIINRLSRLT